MFTQTDYALWIEQTVNLLKEKNYHNVDWENLIEEIESLGRSQKRELRNRLITMLEHCLKLCYSDYFQDYRGWTETIRRSQRELKGLLQDSPSLKQYWHEIFPECYVEALVTLRENPDYQSFPFPDDCPFSQEIDQILQETSWREY
ncbi:DUF29 domain-containing protein [Anabaena cylindrica FACHB-243]|uniref:DUF29 domain-containing protein n=1 Tax=Anabaena cylindrica (strain ATCC 27899 / PCC 7122) TaxID=272123 RepID=K9ZIV8_ANACC|nr:MULTISPECIES: DUF29 domain-containing protein [Anabaena]AFZ58497.1 protein of unknown function DUF29 [Anabaena cylindrica PCC 7122]MBD2417282.1 DUF29 domain-containing protein [Anabaena cylindrica FACHB-243]MBY5281403.1 DUF29 domain-containing protein [Anabaena sp. CCAP 1446/1C]MBY5310206.1 DUF29 domain-containing protein [Anabaena sp. CCAP 1446/1C]MCM2410027.1 DUF29 domain-containing protein [Anabaena sp. CCAP 1446/1C]